MSEPRIPRRPSSKPPAAIEALGERSNPIDELHMAHETAAILLHSGRAAEDPVITDRLVALVDDIGIEELTELWARRPGRSLPGALYRLYLLREWTGADPEQVAREYAAGAHFAEPSHAVAGAEPPGPDEVRRVADAILRGAFTGDFAIALERASAFCQVVVRGRAELARHVGELGRAGKLQQVARDLAASAKLWRSGALE